MSFARISKPPDGLEGTSGFLGKKWLEAVQTQFENINDTQEYGISANGTTQSAATLLNASVSAIGAATPAVNDAVKLPLIRGLKKFPRVVHNATAGNVTLYPNVGDNFFSAAVDAGTVLASGATVVLWPISTTTWVIK